MSAPRSAEMEWMESPTNTKGATPPEGEKMKTTSARGRPAFPREADATRLSLRGFRKSLHKRLKQYALDHECTLEEAFNRVIEAGLTTLTVKKEY